MNAGFYDENMGRSFPLLARAGGTLPNDVLVDFGGMLGPDAGYAPDTDVHYLHAVRRTSDGFEFEIRSTCSGLANLALTFCRATDDPRFVTEHVDAAAIDSEELESEGADCEQEPLWTGYLVTGDLTALAVLLPDVGDVLTGGSTFVLEPALITNLSQLNSVSLANQERTRVTAADGCRPPCYDYTRHDHYIRARCLQGLLRFMAGYNLSLTQNAADNSLTFAARVGSGAGEPCDEVPLFVGETPPNGSELLTGGPRCDETIRSLNGVGGRLFALTGGPGVSVTASTVPHQLTIRIGTSIISDQVSEESEEANDGEVSDCDPPAANSDPCDCGDEQESE